MNPAPGRPAPGETTSSRGAQRELRDFLRRHEQRRRQLPRALVVGLVAGLVAVVFARCLEEAERLRGLLMEWAAALGPIGFLLPLAVCSSAAGLAVYLVARFAPEAKGSGIPHLKAVLHRLRELRWGVVIPVKFMSGVLGIGAGFALGREGPTVQMGGAVGQMISGWFRCTPRERQTLIAAGAGAGLSAAFNAPLAGLVFVLEEVQRDFSPAVFTVTLIASVTADVTCRFLLGDLPVLGVEMHPIPALATLPLYLLLGLVAAPLGVVFNRSLIGSLNVAARLPSVPSWAKGAAVGAAIAAVGWLLPGSIGGGGRLVVAALAGSLSAAELFGLFPLRLLLTAASYGTGTAGGIFTPMLVLGGILGAGAGTLADPLLPGLVHPATFAVVGMAAFFAAVVRAPLTGIVLMVEMTGDYALVLPLLIASLTAAGVADFLRDRPIYEALLQRDLAGGKDDPHLGEALLIDLTVAAGSEFDGRQVRHLGLPPGCILVTVQRGVSSEVPTADFTLADGDRISVLVSPRAAQAVPLLRAGTEAHGIAAE